MGIVAERQQGTGLNVDGREHRDSWHEPHAENSYARGRSMVGILSRDIYASPNGDRWLLVGDLVTLDLFVRHVPGQLSGGRSHKIDLGTFLSGDPGSPEHRELMQMLWEVVQEQT